MEVLSDAFQSFRGFASRTGDIAVLGLSKSHSKNIFHVSERYRKATMSTLRVAFLSSFALDFFTMLSVATVAVFLGLRLIDGQILLGPALTALILAPEYFLPVREVGNDYHATLNGQEAGKTIQTILAQPGFKEEKPLELDTWTDGDELQLTRLSVRESMSEFHLSFKGKKNRDYRGKRCGKIDTH